MSEDTQVNQTAQAAPAASAAQTQEERTYTKADLENIIKDRLERQRRANETAAAKAAEEARLKALQENGEFKKLYEEQQAALDAAKQQLSTLERYEQTLLAQLEREKAGLPQYIIDLLAEKSVVDQLEYLNKHAKSLRQSTEAPAPSLNGAAKSAKTAVDPKQRAEELQRRYPSLKISK